MCPFLFSEVTRQRIKDSSHFSVYLKFVRTEGRQVGSSPISSALLGTFSYSIRSSPAAGGVVEKKDAMRRQFGKLETHLLKRT